MKKFFLGILAAALLIFQTSVTFAAPKVEVNENIYKWIQSTPRGNYWFNYQVCTYRVNDDETLDLNILEVPTIIIYDNIQIDDVVQKRRWRMQSTRGYNNLIGRADYLEFNLKNETVQIVRRADLDHTFTDLDSYSGGEPIKLSELAEKDVSRKFYYDILRWIRENNDWVIQRSRGKLNAHDAKLKPSEMPIFKIKIPAK